MRRKMERTFIAVKPDGLRRGIVGEVIKRFEQKTYKLVAMKLMQVTPELASKHYAEHYIHATYHKNKCQCTHNVASTFNHINTFPNHCNNWS